jgi:ribose transport system substrate-binding protein
MQRLKVRIEVAVAAVALTLIGAGCEPAATTTTNTSTPAVPLSGGAPPAASAARLSEADLDAVTKADRPYRLALIVKTRNNPFFDPMIKAAEAEAKALGATLQVQAPAQESDKERQFAMVQDMVAQKVDGILITPADSKGIVPALKQAIDKGTLVLNLDNRVDAGAGGLALAGYVGADNEEGGKLAGQAMVDALHGTGKVAILEGIRGTDNGEARKRGFRAGVEGKLEVVASESADWDTQKAYAKVQSMLAAHPEIQGLFCANDKMALGALKAIAEAGKKGQITVVGYDNIADVRSYLDGGELQATIEQHPDLMGKYGVRAAVGILNGKIEKGKEFLVPLEVIRTKSK